MKSKPLQKRLGLGLKRGEHLINEYLSLKAACNSHHTQNDQVAAFRILDELSQRLAQSKDPKLAEEIEFIAQLQDTLSFLSGHAEETATVSLALKDGEGVPDLEFHRGARTKSKVGDAETIQDTQTQSHGNIPNEAYDG